MPRTFVGCNDNSCVRDHPHLERFTLCATLTLHWVSPFPETYTEYIFFQLSLETHFHIPTTFGPQEPNLGLPDLPEPMHRALWSWMLSAHRWWECFANVLHLTWNLYPSRQMQQVRPGSSMSSSICLSSAVLVTTWPFSFVWKRKQLEQVKKTIKSCTIPTTVIGMPNPFPSLLLATIFTLPAAPSEPWAPALQYLSINHFTQFLTWQF